MPRAEQPQPSCSLRRATARAQLSPAVFVPAEFYGSATQWSLSLGARIHAGTMRRRMGRYALPATVRAGMPSGGSPSPHTHP